MSTKVFIINRGVHDFACAKRFGELTYLSDGPVSKYATTVMMREFSKALKDSTEEDYILLTSLTVMCVIACVIFAMKHKKLNLLLLKDNDYTERRLDLSELG
jgi:hypothetical protein